MELSESLSKPFLGTVDGREICSHHLGNPLPRELVFAGESNYSRVSTVSLNHVRPS